MSKKQIQKKSKPNNSSPVARKAVELKDYPNAWFYFCWAIYLCYCFAAFEPTGPVWGIHFIAYIPAGMRVLLLIIGGLLLVPNIQRSFYLGVANLFGSEKTKQKIRILPAAIVAGICFMLFHTFTMKTDIYGDNIRILKGYADNSKFDWNWIGDMFSPQLDVNKEALTVAIHRIVAHCFSISIESSYQIMSEFFGALFILAWLLFVQKITNMDDWSSRPLRIVLILLGLFAGAVQVFLGHVENYSFGILTYTLFLISLYFYIEGKLGTLGFVFLYLLAFKAHIIAILFFPAFLVALAYHYRNTLTKVQFLFTWRAILMVVILPAFVIGVLLYVFLFHSWNEPYAYTTGRGFEQAFLPIVTLPPPLDHYSLWLPYHIADFCNLLLLTSAPIVVILVNLMIFNHKEISWSQPRVIVFGLAALFPFLFFMALSPNLTPVRDWDVYTLLFPPLLFFTSMLLVQPGVRAYVTAWLAQTVVFGVIFTSVFVAVDASPNELQPRLLDAGAYIYHSYYATSKFIETRAFAINEDSKPALIHFSNIVHELSLVPTHGTDQELAAMMAFIARFHANAGNDSAALSWELLARKTDTSFQKYFIDLAAYYLQLNRLDDGTRTVEEFLKNKTERKDTDRSYDEELATVMSQLGARYSRTGNDSSTVFWAEAARKLQPLNLKYTYDIADYYTHTGRAHQALDLLQTIPPDSVSVKGLTTTAIVAAYAFGPDSGLPYLYKAKAIAPNDSSVDSLIMEMQAPGP